MDWVEERRGELKFGDSTAQVIALVTAQVTAGAAIERGASGNDWSTPLTDPKRKS